MKPENDKQHVFWTALDALGASGETYATDGILTQGANNIAYFFYHALGGTTGIWYAYCRIGTSAGGGTCNDPFVH